MVGICFEYSARDLLRNQWLLLIRNFDVQAYERNVAEDEVLSDGITAVKTAGDLPENMPLVVLAPQNGEFIQSNTPLPDFKHPQDALYYFGPDNTHLSKEELGVRTYETVYIPLKTGENLWSPQAGLIVLYDRLLKQHYGNS